MDGSIPFDKALNERLKILSINHQSMLDGIKLINSKITNTFLENSQFISTNNNNIYIVSGGFSEFIRPVADILGFKSEHIFCNSFIRHKNNYELDERNIMAQNKGKVEVVKQLGLKGFTIVIGDGYTDYEIKKHGYADLFIAYTEHENRNKVSNLADYKSNSFTDILEYINSL